VMLTKGKWRFINGYSEIPDLMSALLDIFSMLSACTMHPARLA
jgi:hypothetical protein